MESVKFGRLLEKAHIHLKGKGYDPDVENHQPGKYQGVEPDCGPEKKNEDPGNDQGFGPAIGFRGFHVG